MARRSDHSREELYTIILDAAHEIAEAEGYSGLTARAIADKIGYSQGTLYNVFANLDDLIIRLRGQVLDELYDFLIARSREDESEAMLIEIARNYIVFVRKHPKLWNLMFEHNLPGKGNGEAPDWYLEKTRRLLSLAEKAIASFFSTAQEKERFHHAQVLWTALHGICSIQIAGKLVKKESAEAMAQSLITIYVDGLRYKSGGASSRSTITKK